MYITFVDYDPDKIRCAVECIDNLSERIQELEKINEFAGYNISKEILDQINDEYQKFFKYKDNTIANMKEAHKKIISQIEEFKMPNLAIYLNDKYASVQNSMHICKICNGSFGSKSGLSSHMKVHNSKTSKVQKTSKSSSSKEIIIDDDDSSE
jgi:hypothetical protein